MRTLRRAAFRSWCGYVLAQRASISAAEVVTDRLSGSHSLWLEEHKRVSLVQRLMRQARLLRAFEQWLAQVTPRETVEVPAVPAAPAPAPEPVKQGWASSAGPLFGPLFVGSLATTLVVSTVLNELL